MPKGYIDPNYMSREEAEALAAQRQQGEAVLEKMAMAEVTRRRHRRWLLVSGLTLLVLWLPFEILGYGGCAATLAFFGGGLLATWALEGFLLRLTRREE